MVFNILQRRSMNNKQMIKGQKIKGRIARQTLSWYDHHGRNLPWREDRGNPPDPYRVWIAEIMLQQTTAITVGPRYLRFVSRWPDVEALASAPIEDVLGEWAGLGYYARARNLHACAVTVARDLACVFPSDLKKLRTLPGIGAYTAAAIAAIAFERRVLPIDSNIRRILCRYLAFDQPFPQGEALLSQAAQELAPKARAGAFAEALMDLGALICKPKDPICSACPLRLDCRSRDDPQRYPVVPTKGLRPVRHGLLYYYTCNPGAHILLVRRPAKGLLGGMLALPSSPWETVEIGQPDAYCQRYAPPIIPSTGNWTILDRPVRHVFTHFTLIAQLAVASTSSKHSLSVGHWSNQEDLASLPTLMHKAVLSAREQIREMALS